MRRFFLGIGLAIFAAAPAFAAQERQFSSGVRWVPLNATIESYVRVEPKAPICGGGRTIIMVFDSPEQAEDDSAVRNAVDSAARSLVQSCKMIRNIGVEGHLRENDHPDDRGAVPAESRMLSAAVGVTSGQPKILLMRNKVLIKKQEAEQAKAAAAAQAEYEAKLAKQREEEKSKRKADEARFLAQRAEFAAHLAKVRGLSQPKGGWQSWFGGGAERELIGVWSNPDGHCDTDLLILYVEDDHRAAEFWSRVGGLQLAPVYQGDWAVADNIVQLRYTKTLRGGGFDKSIEVKEETVSGRVRLISVEDSSLTITIQGVVDPHPLFLFYPAESKLLRC